MADINIAPLNDRAAFLEEWEALYAYAADPSFFHTPAWIKSWLDGAPYGAKLKRISVRKEGAPILMGAFSSASRKPPMFGLQEHWFHEFGDAERDAIYAEYVDFLAAPEATHEIRRDAVCAMIEAMGAADGFVFRNLTDEMMSAVFSAAAICELSGRVLNEQPVYGCMLSSGNFMETLSSSLKSKITRAMRLYEERGELTARLAKTDDEKAAAWERLKTLHKAGWEARGRPSVFDNPHLTAFHERLQKTAPAACHLFEVKAGDEVIAVLYNFVHGTQVMNYQSGFKFEDDNRLTPGFVAHALAAQHYQESGFEIYDLLAGEAEYKSRLGEPHAIFTSLVLERPTWRNRLRGLFRR
ncbi:MAG: hypothetical protein CMI63_00120 [Parvularcula sp.]|nr:hypothetical protein [Parvularcula sp.]